MTNTKPLRIAFMGTPDFVIPTIKLLHESTHDLICVYTQPPRSKGRKKELQNTPVHKAALELGIEIYHPLNFKDEKDIKAFQDLNLDIAVVAAYGLLLPQAILDAPKFGCLNIHPSLLPRWRGPSPIQYAIWKGDSETGVSVMQLEKAMDAGPVIAQKHISISPDDDFMTLNKTLWQNGNKLLMDALDQINQTKEVESTPQNHDQATYCKLLTKEHGKIDWKQNAQEINCQIRGLNPWPGTWCLNTDNKRLKILKADPCTEKSDGPIGQVLSSGKIICGDNSTLQLIQIQPENKKPMDIQAAINGGYLKENTHLS